MPDAPTAPEAATRTGSADVVVVGGGIIGLTAAVRLLERGARVQVWAADEPARTVSAVAAAVWYPTRTDPGPRVLGWAGDTFAEFRRQAGDGVPGVAMRSTRMLVREPVDAVPWWASVAGDVVLSAAPAPYTGQWGLTVPLVEMLPYLAWLQERIAAAGGRIVRRTVTRLDEALAEAPVVVNATGLAAGSLCGDPAVFPARGQVVLVANPGLDVSVRDEGDPAGITYVHPRSRDVVLGGTYETGRWDTAPDPRTREDILRRCIALVPALADAPLLGEKVGLRPARHGGPRVEAEDRGSGRIVHAYGHGGAGMTLSWGCADDVAGLALADR
jgi:D-amino-acid oxidase